MKNKHPKHQKDPSSEKCPKIAIDPDTYLSNYPSWRFSSCDRDHARWKIGAREFDEEIIEKLRGFESMTWNEIFQASGGRSRGTNNHFIKVEELCTEAQKRLEKMRVSTDVVFSLRLNGKMRLFGLLERGIFKLLWRDNDHEICPSSKKNT